MNIKSVLLVVTCAFAVGAFAAPTFAMSFGIPEVADNLSSATETVEAPSDLRVQESVNTSVTVEWGSDVRTIVADIVALDTVYIATLSENVEGAEVLDTQSTTSTSITFEGLETNHAYLVSVVATRDGVTSAASTAVARTAPDAPVLVAAQSVQREVFHDVISNDPLNQFGESATSKFIAYIKWRAPAVGKTRFFTVNVYSKKSGELLKTVTSKKRHVSVSGLKGKTKYEYEVIAHFNDVYASTATERATFYLGRKVQK